MSLWIFIRHEDRVRLVCICGNGTQRTAFHAQGLCHWTPANIGPYSQFSLTNIFLCLTKLGQSRPIFRSNHPQDPTTGTTSVFKYAEKVNNVVRKSKWGHAQLAMYRPTYQERATGVATACEQLTAVGAILPTSLDRFHLPPGKPYASGTVRDTYLPKGTAIDGKTGGPAHRMLCCQRRRGNRGSSHQRANLFWTGKRLVCNGGPC